MLRCKYDGCNMIMLPPMYDTLALRTAIELIGSDFCFDGDYYPLTLLQSQEAAIDLNEEEASERISLQSQLWCDKSPF
ncbi:hypothetical protein H6F88_01015 [Oculatella sp. FACHB-28]|uniref:hypothetical protein n=1 Tax=Oculatella sp. FACHB-28 TaxID=2692845 RepID=UPI001686CFD1|nr:hypothetical protein [Oculatella sp. FACHB-28]MBD2054622.1 hypothetical protein [Oculatella sp. FACHB-28]